MIANYRYLILALCLLPFSRLAYSQEEIQREVRVVKPYTPTLSDAEKIGLLPVIDDTARSNPAFIYRIYPRRYDTHFTVNPIQPARMVGLPLEKLYKSQFTLGVGNYLTPYAELTVNSLRDRRSSVGLYVKHHSSGGNVKLANNEKVNAPFSDNIAEFQARRINFRSVLEGSITGGYNSSLFYGYNPELDTLLEKDDIRQKIYSAGANLKFYSSHPDSSHFNHSSALNYQLTADAYSNMEHHFKIGGDVSTFISDFYSGAAISLDYYLRSDSLLSRDNVLFRVNPYISKATDEWRFVLGLNTALDAAAETEFRIYPRALFEFNIVKNVLIPYMGVDGYREVNSYRSMIFENPFIAPGLKASNTDYALIGYIGMKGRYSSKMSFDFKASYSSIDSMLFYINDTTNILQNRFIAAWDNVNLLKVGGEVIWNQDEKLKIMLRANYYSYTLDKISKAWHMPGFEAGLAVKYNLRDKILLDADLFFTGKRFAAPASTVDSPYELKPFLDANLGLEYRYTRMLSFFLKFNNMAAAKYDLWNFFPAQRFQILGGFSYAL